MLGREVISLVNGDIDAGLHEVRFDASRLASGVYFYRLNVTHPNASFSSQDVKRGTGDFVNVKTLLLLK